MTLSSLDDIYLPTKLTKTIKVIKVAEEVELVPGGANIPVTLYNREEYIRLTK